MGLRFPGVLSFSLLLALLQGCSCSCIIEQIRFVLCFVMGRKSLRSFCCGVYLVVVLCTVVLVGPLGSGPLAVPIT